MGEKGAEGPAERAAVEQQQQQQQQQLLRRRQELDYHWKKNAPRLRRRNLLTGLAIGAFVVGMFSYTIVSVKQERIVEELDDEARIHISRGPRTSANS
ncbi:cytochrome c oxidase assembly factor 3 homolog, mitochondrial [Scophthalmus maximus]|uniref:cytochrome c oxidase assembly factor 3 homolog, mitochondrial n=1 Tax=Scophthalmus maximus TaxID=52904 RepID=UPI0015E0B778|nr:cytochrome c oxidase assembly factor 3 homolog, mitochondrial [Scophthalmus maximus]